MAGPHGEFLQVGNGNPKKKPWKLVRYSQIRTQTSDELKFFDLVWGIPYIMVYPMFELAITHYYNLLYNNYITIINPIPCLSLNWL